VHIHNLWLIVFISVIVIALVAFIGTERRGKFLYAWFIFGRDSYLVVSNTQFMVSAIDTTPSTYYGAGENGMRCAFYTLWCTFHFLQLIILQYLVPEICRFIKFHFFLSKKYLGLLYTT
jgi:hypothetical protein